ncbi:MAG: sulfatase-like hydrolase/transferase [Bacteroidia bacterium]
MSNRKIVLFLWAFLIAVYSLLRISFVILNFSSFSLNSPTEILMVLFAGLRFDLSAIFITNVLVSVILLLPLKFHQKSARIVITSLFLLSNLPFLLFNLIDVGYFHFTQKRTTADFFGVAMLGDDFFNMLPSLLRDYWGLLTGFLILSVVLYKSFLWFIKQRTGKSRWWFVEIAVTIGLTVLLFRGGLQYKPISVLTAARYTSNQNVATVLNTTFTILKTIGKDELKNYDFDKKIPSDLTYFNPQHSYANSGVFKPMNVVLIIMESFGKEYTGYFNQGKGYTPFLDSLMQHSLTCTNAFANGKKSIEGIPGIVSGIPALMNTPYISGQYNSNNLNSLPFLLKKYGYTSSFYHGGNNGTMGFENFTKMAGYDHYVGRNEYGDKDYDGTWGVYDEPFFQFFCHELNKQKQPFVATIFSLSSHHPYAIPPQYNSRFKEGEQPIHQSVRYADYALQQYFDCAKKQSWYHNTLFIITADHTGPSVVSQYQTRTGIYEVPIVYFAPDDSLLQGQYENVTQHTDIVPGVLNYLHYPDSFKFFGNSIFDKTVSIRFAVSFLDGSYQLITNNSISVTDFDSEYHFVLRNAKAVNDSAEASNTLKVFVSLYNRSMIHNKLTEDE